MASSPIFQFSVISIQLYLHLFLNLIFAVFTSLLVYQAQTDHFDFTKSTLDYTGEAEFF